jgi:hypothetical protein
MTTGDAVCQQFVSIQRPGAPDSDAGHVAWGVLISDTMVVCRDVGWVEKANRWWDVLVATPPRDGAGTVEHIRMREIDVLGRGSGAGTVALVKLAHAPAHEVRTDVVLDDFDEEEFYRALGAEGNVCAALEAAQVLPPVEPEGSVSQVLGPVDRWEPDRRGLRVASFDPRAPAADAGNRQIEGIMPGDGRRGGAEGAADNTGTMPEPPHLDRILLCFFKRCR